MSRNKDRLGLGDDTSPEQSDPTPAFMGKPGPLTFSTPTEFVELPSGGRFYPENHPLHNREELEIRHMTAKQEDILSSQTLLKKGLAIDRFLESVIVGNNINTLDLLVGDRSALLVAARITGYGEEYATEVTCPSCGERSRFTFDLSKHSLYKGGDELEEITWTDSGTFMTRLPGLKVNVEMRLLTGKDEQYLLKMSQNKKRKKLGETATTDQLRMTIVSVEGRSDPGSINALVEHLPAKDSRYLKEVFTKATPNIDLTQDFECSNCLHQQELEVPLTAEFFWPK